MRSPFNDDIAAREVLEAIRWPEGLRCPHCGAGGADVFKIGGEKRSHRDGLYQCKPCRQQFTVTVGTALERLRVPLSTWIRAAHAFSYEGPAYGRDANRKRRPPPLSQLQTEIGVSYRTVLRMRDIIKRAAAQYRGYKAGFGILPRSFMKPRTSQRLQDYRYHKRRLLEERKHPSQHAIRSLGVLAAFMPARENRDARAAFDRTEQLLRLLLNTPAKPVSPARRQRSARKGTKGEPVDPSGPAP